jgi:hypothetical protein
MQSPLDVQQIIVKTRQYEFSDGLRDMQLALMWLAYGLMSWVSFDLISLWLPALIQLRERIGPLAGLSSIACALIPALLVLAALGVITFVRKRWLWRKTGMVKPHRMVVKRRVNVISAVILLVGLGIAFGLMQLGLVDSNFTLRALLASSGVSFGYTMAAMGGNLSLPRYKWVGWVGGLLSLPTLAAPVTLGQFGLILGGMWTVVLVAGGISPLIDAVRAARATQEAQEAGDDRRD